MNTEFRAWVNYQNPESKYISGVGLGEKTLDQTLERVEYYKNYYRNLGYDPN